MYYWRNHLFAATVLYILPLGILGFVPGIYLAVLEGLWYLVVADLIGILSLLIIAFVPAVPVYIRKLLFIGVFYNISIALLVYLGLYGPGMMFLAALVVFTVLILDRVYGVISLVLNISICTFFAVAIYYTLWDIPLTQFYDLQSWIAVSSNLVILSALAVLLIPRLFNGLQKNIDEQERLKSQLEVKQKELEISLDKLSDKNRELESFAMVASHDMKEPLRMIGSFMQLLKDNYSERLDDKAKKYIHFAVDGANRMSAMIDELLEYSRIGRKYSELDQIDTNQLVLQVIEYLRPVMEEKNAKIEKGDLPKITGVTVAVKMLFQNLLENALKYSGDRSPRITITAEKVKEFVQFEISDNGIGIEEEYQDQIFLMFKRLHSNSEIKGSGMGLAICKKIVDQHGGSIRVFSTPGEGSTFIFTFPEESKKVSPLA
ncbi:GHKL domain-containing protein [Rhodohalobacter sp. SW132]|uniref:sensor histidine kinase n=1 Tax=Rhodohalobacter sp. SW132 TaxID=2293433 RepID=UPI000E253320|nr:ATP-binding protein [Rhodohalobacter sp. SW132]REL29127.1 GHKL domain-containing protein [Rhodohalobacter sp. SW132]